MAITTQFLTGFEHGLAVAGLTSTAVNGAATVISTTPRTGTYYGHLAAPGNAACNFQQTITGSPTLVLARFAIKVTGRPAARAEITRIATSAGGGIELYVNQNGLLQMGAGVGVGAYVDGPTIDTTNWHVVEIQADVHANPWTWRWKVDNSNQPDGSYAVTASVFTSFNIGTLTTNQSAFTMDVDDWIHGTWTTSTDWYGDGFVEGLAPTVAGTNSMVDNDFATGDAGTQRAASFNFASYLNKIPFATARNTTNNVAQQAIGNTKYVEVKAATAQTSGTANAVRAILSHSAPSGSGTSLHGARVLNSAGGSTDVVAVGTTTSEGTNAFNAAFVTKPVAGWTPTEVNAILMRWGYSADITPVPTGQSWLLEVDWYRAWSTPVNANASTLKWDLAAAVAQTSILKWDLVAQINSAAERVVWDLRAPVNATARTVLWDLFAEADAAASVLKWDLVAQVNAAARALKWDLSAQVNGTGERLLWDLYATINAVTRSLKWDLFAETDAAVLSLIWDLAGEVITPVNAAALALIYDLFAEANANTGTLKWDLRAATTSDPLRAVWDLYAAVAATRALKWDLLAETAGGVLRLVWDLEAIGAVDGLPLDLLWDLRAAVSKTSGLKWDVFAQTAGSPERLLWDLYVSVVRSRSLKWDLYGEADTTVRRFVWDLRNQTNSDPTRLLWDLRAAVTQTRTLKWDLYGAVARSRTFKWDLFTSLNGNTRRFPWDLRAQADGSQQRAIWNLYATTDANPVRAKWDLYRTVDRVLSLVWDVLQAGGVNALPLRAQWNLYAGLDALRLLLVWAELEWASYTPAGAIAGRKDGRILTPNGRLTHSHDGCVAVGKGWVPQPTIGKIKKSGVS